MGKEAFDNYPTPPPLAEAITKFCFELFPNKSFILEPSCGAGNFLRPAKQCWPKANMLGVDMVLNYQEPVQQLGVQFVQSDFMLYAPMLGPTYLTADTLVITNPPYSEDLPQRFIEVISQNAQPGCHIAFLLRQAFLGGVGRALHFKERKSLRIKRDIAGRPKFNPNDKHQDHSEYAVFIYEVGYKGHYIGWEDPLLWKQSHLKRQAQLLNPEKMPALKPKKPRKKKEAIAA
jgi:hypothetical protein